MTEQLGRTLLLKVGDGGGPEVFTSIAGITSKSITINNEAIDVTTPDASDPGGSLWSKSLGGLKAVSVSGDATFKDDASELRLNAVAMASNPVANFQIIIPDFGTYAAEFRVTSFELSGESTGSVTFSISLESSGAVTFTAE